MNRKAGRNCPRCNLVLPSPEPGDCPRCSLLLAPNRVEELCTNVRRSLREALETYAEGSSYRQLGVDLALELWEDAYYFPDMCRPYPIVTSETAEHLAQVDAAVEAVWEADDRSESSDAVSDLRRVARAALLSLEKPSN